MLEKVTISTDWKNYRQALRVADGLSTVDDVNNAT